MTAGLVTWGILKQTTLDPPTCTICDGGVGHVNGVDSFFRDALRVDNESNRSRSETIGYVLGYGLAPAAAIALGIAVPAADGRIGNAPLDLLLVLESGLVFGVIQQGLTLGLPRERPYVHFAEGQAREAALAERDSFESFPGGHNGLVFTLAAAGGTIATMRGYRYAPAVWITGGSIALATSYFRLAADLHYATDMATGAVVGVATGIAVPLLFHGRSKTRWLEGASLSTSEVPGGRIVSIGWSM